MPLCIILTTRVVYFSLGPPLVDPLFLLFCHVEAQAPAFSAHLVGRVYKAQCFPCIILILPSEGDGTVLVSPMRKLRLGELKCFAQSSSSQRSNPQGTRHPA